MTREEFWEIVKKLVRKDYWDAQSVPPKEIKEILTNSLLIPKPKFKVGDKFREYSVIFEIENVFYDFNLGTWVYGYWWGGTEFCTIRESELELTERKKNE